VMLEKLVEQPRHIEVQVFGDSHGNVVHLYERDCSLQRRRQKVLEEAPAPGMPEAVRKAMTDAAVALAKAVKYEGAGTVEFIVDGSKPLSLDTFWFLEMNTRLQVEHPVTEMITGQDLVEWQLLVASGEELPLTQDAIPLHGHAIEARICAEDPAQGFMPGAGLILEFGMMEPADGEIVRWDAGFETGDRVPSNYDSMIAKLIVHEGNRHAACERLIDTLSHLQLAGVPSNAGFLSRCAASEAFLTHTHHVNWIAEQGEALTEPPSDHTLAAVLAVADVRMSEQESAAPWDIRDGWRMNSAPVRKAMIGVGAEADWVDPDAWDLDPETPTPLVTDISPRRYAVTTGGDTVLVEVPEYDADVEAVLGGDTVSAPMPGKVLSIHVEAGAEVTRGDTVAVMEAMKMEHALTAPRDGIVETVTGKVGDQVSEGDVLVQLVAE